jgi:hypothetical protein
MNPKKFKNSVGKRSKTTEKVAVLYSCKTSHACLAVVVLSTISKVVSSRYWWMIVGAS